MLYIQVFFAIQEGPAFDPINGGVSLAKIKLHIPVETPKRSQPGNV
jgi:hypothetical protein